MTSDEKIRIFRRGDSSPEAIRHRLIAARKSTGLTQNDFAKEAGIIKTTYNTQEMRGAPSIKAMRHLYVQYRIDFNYLLFGDFAQLPADVQDTLESNLTQAAE